MEVHGHTMAKYAAMPEDNRTRRPKERPIERTTRIGMVTVALPQAKPLLAEYGIHCFSCAGSETETLEEGCKTHDMDNETLENLLDDLNTLFEEQPKNPANITISATAAQELQNLSGVYKGNIRIFTVMMDPHGHPYMEQCERLIHNLSFCHSQFPHILITTDPLTLYHLGTVSIDFRNERFTLDTSSSESCGCKEKMGCSYTKNEAL